MPVRFRFVVWLRISALLPCILCSLFIGHFFASLLLRPDTI